MSWLAPFYTVIKALHIISVVAWMAGLLYLPRLFVYHADAPAGSPVAETFKVMERRLLRGIMNPAMIAAYIFGIAEPLRERDHGDAHPRGGACRVAALVRHPRGQPQALDLRSEVGPDALQQPVLGDRAVGRAWLHGPLGA